MFISIVILSTVCNDSLPLGIEDRRIPDSSFFVSTEYHNIALVATNARLNRPARYNGSLGLGGWRAARNDQNPYVGVNLGSVKIVSGIVLQGREDTDEWVTQFKVAYKAGADWMVVKDANQEGDMVRCFHFITSTRSHQFMRMATETVHSGQVLRKINH